MANIVSFATGTAAEFAAATKNENTLYFITDEQRLYKGEIPFGGFSYKKVPVLPETGAVNTFYIADNGNVAFWNGTEFVTVTAENVTAISASSTNNQIPTAKAVHDYVATEIANVAAGDMVDAIKGLVDRIAANETAIAEKADKGTSLADYGIADAYTKTETNSQIATAIAAAGHLTREVVTALPDAADAEDNIIYLIAKADGSDNQKFDEYMLVNGTMEKIGDSSANLTGYATEKYVDDAITASETSIGTSITNGVKDAKDYADSLANNYATADQGAKADSAVQKVEEGATNGTVAVDGTDVAVHGLKSAAYADTADFEVAGALSTAKKYTDDEIIKALTWNTL